MQYLEAQTHKQTIVSYRHHDRTRKEEKKINKISTMAVTLYREGDNIYWQLSELTFAQSLAKITPSLRELRKA